MEGILSLMDAAQQVIEELVLQSIRLLVKKRSFVPFTTKKVENQRQPRITTNSKKQLQIVVVLGSIYQLLATNRKSTAREIYYTHKAIFDSQKKTDNVIENITLLLGSTLQGLHISKTPRGLLCGDVALVTQYYIIDFSTTHQLPTVSEPFTLCFGKKRVFLLIIEKEAFFERVVQSKVREMFPCLILCSRGFPDNATLDLAKAISSQSGVIPCCLVDGDVYGIEIFLQFLCNGWKNPTPQIPNLRWALLRPSEFNGVSSLTKREQKIAENMLNSSVVQNNEEIKNEINTIAFKNRKAELDELDDSHKFNLENIIITSCLTHTSTFKI
ncbi:meiotic recombination protein SPO11, putative [Entamoeba invadens IP1]|uniref:DNA topoisomerase (ATP-hydrolyzing) n=1 Tax=Entamoeba invadens IP1 TaxID=370355 RepID=A0A0A1UGL1_ENTIV|nr:meiotic recombination protein SPO11, putative [Entamoeba invadens IP1]ELP92777.1 meiotic recombination protein SPO11, putative [Entamoeba invadens IP1]|eukprot:XP_004259548.1 meiotic recombination protein SPO11, putative [Entamoeba invadens IP1]